MMFKQLGRSGNYQRRFVGVALTIITVFFSVVVTIQATTNLATSQNTNQQWTWIDFWNSLFVRKKTPQGRRGDGIWLCAPNSKLLNAEVVWNDKPLFLWHGSAQEIQLRLPPESKPFWKYPISESSATEQSLIYDGPPLQPGQTYEWQVFNYDKNISSGWSKFQIMDTQERQAIADKLSQLETKGASAEDIALQRANVFANNQLWLDVLQELLSVKTLNVELNKTPEQLSSRLCNDS